MLEFVVDERFWLRRESTSPLVQQNAEGYITGRRLWAAPWASVSKVLGVISECVQCKDSGNRPTNPHFSTMRS